MEKDLRNPRNSSVFLRLAHSNATILLQPPMRDKDDFLLASKITLEGQLLAGMIRKRNKKFQTGRMLPIACCISNWRFREQRYYTIDVDESHVSFEWKRSLTPLLAR